MTRIKTFLSSLLLGAAAVAALGRSPRARFAPVDLGASASTLADVSEPAAEEFGQTLTLSLHRPATISGDRTLLGLALSNLIDNALRYSPPGPARTTP